MRTLHIYKTIIVAGLLLASGTSSALTYTSRTTTETKEPATVNYLSDLNCNGGQVPVYTGSNWICGDASGMAQTGILANQYRSCSDSNFGIKVNQQETDPSWASVCGDLKSSTQKTNMFLRNKAVDVDTNGAPRFRVMVDSEEKPGITAVQIDPYLPEQPMFISFTYSSTDIQMHDWAQNWMMDGYARRVNIHLTNYLGRSLRYYVFYRCNVDSFGKTSSSSVLTVKCSTDRYGRHFGMYGDAQRDLVELFNRAIDLGYSTGSIPVDVIYTGADGREFSVSEHNVGPAGYIFPRLDRNSSDAFVETFIFASEGPEILFRY